MTMTHTWAAALVAMTAVTTLQAAALPMADGPFKPDMDSLRQYTCPDWFRDAKFGIWAHWGPQAVPMMGDWYYNKNWKFRPVSWTLHMLVDIVSKNGNLLLNVVQRPDGSLDPEVEQALEEMARWIGVHGEAIYGTRPWLVYGEGSVKAKGGSFKEDFAYTSKDIRFTTHGATLYAIALGWPADGRLVVRSLAQGAGKITDLSLLGYKGQVQWRQTPDGLVVTVPSEKVSEYTCALKITGTDLKPVALAEVVEPVRPDAKGTLTLSADAAERHGDQIKQEEQGGHPNIGFWDRGEEWVSWKVQFVKAGTFKVTAQYATVHPDSEFVVEVAGQSLTGKASQTGGWAEFRTLDLGLLEVKQPGEQTVKVRPRDAKTWKAINLRSVRLTPAE